MDNITMCCRIFCV